MSKPEFFPSHRITLRSGEVEEVMLIDGAAYTRDEWESETVADYECDEAGAWTFQGEPFAGAVGEIKPPRPWPTIRNCNFAARHDDRGRHVREALTAAGRGCEDCDLIGALDNLEATLADHAESDSEESMRLCREAEEAVESAFLAIGVAFDKAD